MKDVKDVIVLGQKDVFKILKRATVAIGILNDNDPKHPFEIFGSGFCIDSSGIIVTCRHVFDSFLSKPVHQQIQEMDLEEHNKGKEIKTTGPLSSFETIRPFAIFYITDHPSQKLIAIPNPVDFIMARTDKDITLMRLVKHKFFLNGYPFLEVEDYSNLHEGDDVGLCGFPLGTLMQHSLGTLTSSFSKGMISSIIPAPNVPIEYLDGFQLDITATNGNSGGPVFMLDNGKVIGALMSGPVNSQGQVISGFAKAISIYSIINDIPEIKNISVNGFINENFKK